MKSNAKVAIIVPAYNVEQYIARGIESCINQTYKNIEIIVVDDGSSDNTYHILQEYQLKDNRIILCHQENQGVSAARNKAISLCTSEYLIFLDSDDWLELNTVETFVNKLENIRNEKVLISSNCYFAKDGLAEREIAEDEENNVVLSSSDALMFIGNPKYKLRSSCYKLFSLEVIKNNNLRFETNIKHGEDGLFVFEYLKCVDKFIYMPIPLWNILLRPGSATRVSFNKGKLTAITAIEKMMAYDNDAELQMELKKFLTKRTLYLLFEAMRSKNEYIEDVLGLRKRLRCECQLYMKTEKNYKQKMIYLFATFAPRTIVKYVLTKKQNIKRK